MDSKEIKPGSVFGPCYKSPDIRGLEPGALEDGKSKDMVL